VLAAQCAGLAVDDVHLLPPPRAVVAVVAGVDATMISMGISVNISVNVEIAILLVAICSRLQIGRVIVAKRRRR